MNDDCQFFLDEILNLLIIWKRNVYVQLTEIRVKKNLIHYATPCGH